MSIRQRIRDYLREREIDRLGAGCREAYYANDKAKARQFYQELVLAITSRSPGQRERMEQRQMKRMDPLSRRIFEANRVRPGRE